MEICDTSEKYFQRYVAAYEKAAYEEGWKEGFAQWLKEAALRIARRMIDLEATDEEILEVVDVTAEELAVIHKEMIESEKNRKDRWFCTSCYS